MGWVSEWVCRAGCLTLGIHNGIDKHHPAVGSGERWGCRVTKKFVVGQDIRWMEEKTKTYDGGMMNTKVFVYFSSRASRPTERL